MSGDSINDEIMGAPEEEITQPMPEAPAAGGGGFRLPDWVKAQTGPGPLEQYVDHALNFNKSKALARIIRGMTGIIGEMNYAIVDIAMGVLEFVKPQKQTLPYHPGS